MPLYEYECTMCGLRTELQRRIAERNDFAVCVCSGEMTLQIGTPASWEKKHPRIISEAQVVAERGRDWRETKGSIRMARGESERSYLLPQKKS